MKVTSHILISVITIILYSSGLKAQDTLYLKSGQIVPSKIIEISPLEIKYKKAHNRRGPIFITNRSDINFIKYESGTIDTMKAVEPANTIAKTYVTEAAPKAVDAHPPIYPSGPLFKYDGIHINARKAENIMLDMNDPELSQYVKTERLSKRVALLRFIAFPALTVGSFYAFGALYDNFFSPNEPYITTPYAPGIISGAIGVACLGTYITFERKKRKNMRAALALYNEKY